MQKSVTVIIPVYNGEKYLEDMLRSLLNQTCPPQQILISDDASTDRSLELIRRFRRICRERNIEVRTFCHRHNVGLSRNVSSMRRYIRGDYILFADQDDIWKADKIERQVRFLEKYPEDMACICNRFIIDEAGQTIRRREKDMKDDMASTGHQDFERIIMRRSNCPFNALALRNRAIDVILDIPEEICEQDTYMVVMASTYGKIGFLKESLVGYRIHESNLSGNYYLKMSENLWKCYWKLVYKNRRYNYKTAVDGNRIRQSLLEKRGIRLEDYKNGLLGLKPKQIYKDAWIQLKEAAGSHSLGEWKKNA